MLAYSLVYLHDSAGSKSKSITVGESQVFKEALDDDK